MAVLEVVDRPRQMAVRGDRIFDGDRLVEGPVVVVLDGDTIAGVLPGSDAPRDAALLDLPGTTLLPGLVDTHVHLAFDATADPVDALARRDDGEALATMTSAARTALLGGVTTVRDLGDRDYLALQLRGRDDLPTIVAAGPPLTTPGGHCHFLGGEVADEPDAVRAAVREHAERGVDVIKIMASGGTMTPGTRQEEPHFEEDTLAAAVDEAHRLGLPVTAHAHGTAAIARAVAAGVDGMEHVSFWTATGVDSPEPLLQQIARQRIAVGATLGMLPPPPGLTPPAEVLARLPAILANTRLLVELGAVVVFGTDAGIAPVKPHDVLRTALGQSSEIGLSSLQALHVATAVAAEVVGLGDRKGRLVPGYDADLVAVAGNPIEDPLAIHAIRTVVVRGTVFR